MGELKPCTIVDDKREIERIDWNDDQGGFLVGSCGVTAIVAYGEPGPHCHLPWLAVYEGEQIRSRVPAEQVQITYRRPVKE